MKILIMTILTTLVSLSFSIAALAAPPEKCSPWPECKGEDPDPPSGSDYTAALTEGGFRFNASDITSQKRNIYRGETAINMERAALPGTDQLTWDGLLDACLPATVLPNTVNSIFVNWDNWSITNAGGRSTDTAGSRVTIMFNDIVDGSVVIDFSLIGELDFDGQFHPPTGVANTITLDKARIWGADNDNHAGCQSGEVSLSSFVILEICHKYSDGSGCD